MTWVQNACVCLWWNVKGYNQYERTDGSSGKNRVSLRIRRGKERRKKKKKGGLTSPRFNLLHFESKA